MFHVEHIPLTAPFHAAILLFENVDHRDPTIRAITILWVGL